MIIVLSSFNYVWTTIVYKGETGTMVDEIGLDADDVSHVLVKIDPRYLFPIDVDLLLGDPRTKGNMYWDRQ